MSYFALLNNKINIQKVALTAVGDGTYTESWATEIGNYSCRINHLRMDEVMDYDKNTVFADYTIFCVYDIRITEKKRIKFDSRTFQIKAVRDYDQMKKYMKIYVLEITD